MALETYLNPFLETYACYASREEHRDRVASGGVVTTLLARLLEAGIVQGVAVCRSSFAFGKLGYEFAIVTDPQKVRQYASNAYYDIPVHKHLREIEAFPGSLAVCALPCHIGLIKRLRDKGKFLNVKLLISLFCGHNCSSDLVRFVMKLHSVNETEVSNLFIRRTYLSGMLEFTMNDGSMRTIPFRNFNVYRSLWFFSKPLCLHCDDHLGSRADISVGDIFTPEFRAESIKHSAVVIRSEVGRRAFSLVKDHGDLVIKDVPAREIVRAQKRIVIPSGDMGSRFRAASLLGIPFRRHENTSFRFRSFLTYLLLYMNSTVTKSSIRRRILRFIPRPVLFGFVAIVKAINTTLSPSKRME